MQSDPAGTTPPAQPIDQPAGQTPDPTVAAPAPAPVFYRIKGSSISFGELWRGAHSPVAVVAWIALRVGGRAVPCSTDDPAVASLTPFRVAEAVLPAVIRKHFDKVAPELLALGFHTPVFHAVSDPLHITETYLASYAHPTLPVVARLHVRVWGIHSPPATRAFTEFITGFADGSYLWSLSSKYDLDAPPSCRMVRRTSAEPARLWELHQRALAAEPPSRRPLPASTPDQVLCIVEPLHEAVAKFHVMRAVFVPPQRVDEERRTATSRSLTQAAQGKSQHPTVMIELDKLQHKKTSWLTTILLLAVSLAFFIVIGFKGQSLLRVLALVPILLFHECGHYLAMKAFGYRNLRMFFIPGFGAAVTGRHYNIAGWQKVIVYLMGPIPGIILGIIIGLCGMVWKWELAIQAGLLMLILNGFNLLPVLPLDGGHVAHTILFSRNSVLDIAFRVLAAVAVVALGIFAHSTFFIFFAVIMFIGLPQVLSGARVAREIRAEGVATESPDDQTIPPEVAEKIITKLRAGAKRPQTAKIIAQQTLRVYETLNTRAPGRAASAGLLAAHALGFVASAVFGLVFALSLRGQFQQMFRAGAEGPRHALVAPFAQTAPKTPAASGGPSCTIVATFVGTDRAKGEFQSVTAQLKPAERATLFGDTIFIRVPASDDDARKRWLAALRPQASDVFVESKAMAAHFRFAAIARTESEVQAIEDELAQYFRLPLAEHIEAPWSAAAPLTPRQKLARRTYFRLSDASGGVWQDPEMVSINERMLKAQRDGEQDEYKALVAQERPLTASIQRKRFQAIAQESPDAVDVALAKRYLELFDSLKPGEFYKAAAKEFAPLFGQVPEPGANADAPAPTHALRGIVSHVGLVIQLRYVSFADPAAGAPALAAWITSKGCTRLRYDVSGEAEYPTDGTDPGGD